MRTSKNSSKRQNDVIFEPVMASKAMKKISEILRTVASKEVTLTFIGESGSGKEVLARLAHELSERRRGPFVPINCAAIPESLFESELFGHERGAFTGANERVKGKVEAAEGGTLFMDEIGELPMLMQVKLLRFLENLRFMRVGGSVKIDANVRLMFATLRPLEQEVRAGRFRADLFYRIQGLTIHVPALRERREDIAILLEQFRVQLSARHSVTPPTFNRSLKAMLLRYDWPGNVRELRNVVETVCLLREGQAVRPKDLPEALRNQNPPSSSSEVLALELRTGLDAMICRIIEAALALEKGNKPRAAALLQVSPRTIQRYAAAGKIHPT